MEIAHLRLYVPNVTTCFLFYRDIIGLTVLHGDETTPYAEFDTGTVHLALEPLLVTTPLSNTLFSTDFSPNDRIAVIVRVENVDKAFDYFASLNVFIVKPPHDTPEFGMRVAYIRDPAGNLIELNQDL